MTPEDEARLRLIRLDRWFEKRRGWRMWLEDAAVGIALGLLGILLSDWAARQ